MHGEGHRYLCERRPYGTRLSDLNEWGLGKEREGIEAFEAG